MTVTNPLPIEPIDAIGSSPPPPADAPTRMREPVPGPEGVRTVRRLAPPPSTGHAPTDALIERYRELSGLRRDASRRKDRAERELRYAPEADQKAYAEALAAGRKDPGPKVETAARAEFTAATRELDALVGAIGLVQRQAAESATTNVDAIRAAYAKAEAAGVADALDAITTAVTALTAVAEARGVVGWALDPVRAFRPLDPVVPIGNDEFMSSIGLLQSLADVLTRTTTT